MNIKLTIFLIVCAFSYSNCRSQKVFTPTIKVVDSKNFEPIESVYITIVRNNERYELMESTDSGGIAKIGMDKLRSYSSYQCKVDKDGYQYVFGNYYPTKDTIIQLIKDSNYTHRNPKYAYDNCTITEYGNYEPAEIKTWNDLPVKIQVALKTHLISRVGENRLNHIHICGGQLVDINRMHLVDPSTFGYKWKHYRYNICVGYTDTIAGIGNYTSEVLINKKGKIKQEFSFPYRRENDSLVYISLDSALQIARLQGYSEEFTKPEFNFDWFYSNDFQWKLSYTVLDGFGTYYQNLIKMNAFNGEILNNRDRLFFLDFTSKHHNNRFGVDTIEYKQPTLKHEWLNLCMTGYFDNRSKTFYNNKQPTQQPEIGLNIDTSGFPNKIKIYNYSVKNMIDSCSNYRWHNNQWVLESIVNYHTLTKTNTYKYYFDNGQLESIIHVFDGFVLHGGHLYMDGTYEWYYRDGQLKKVSIVSNNVKDCVEKSYAANGALLEEKYYTKGKAYGHWFQYNDQGKITGELFFDQKGYSWGYWIKNGNCFEKEKGTPPIQKPCTGQ